MNEAGKIIKLGFLSSGRAAGIRAVIDASEKGDIAGKAALLICNTERAPIIEFAKTKGVEVIVLRPDLFNSKEDYDAKLTSELWDRGISLVLTNDYHRFLSAPIISAYKDRILNVHDSLLPAFSGKGLFGKRLVAETIKRGVKFTGCTVHYVTENMGEGKILDQEIVEVEAGEDEASLSAKLAECEKKIYLRVVKNLLTKITELDPSKKPYAISGSTGLGTGSIGTGTPVAANEYYNDQQKRFSFESNGKQIFGICDVGLQRKENMDTILVTGDMKILGAADGIGSAKGGKQTSRMTMSMIERKWLEEGSKLNLSGIEHGTWLRKTVIDSNSELLRWNDAQVPKYDLGSTLVIGLVDYENDEIYISNTGDSRAYLWRSGVMYRLTRDHSEGYNPETGEGGGLLFYIGGSKGAFGLDLFQLKLFEGDKILFCSDGLLYATEDRVIERFEQNLEIKDMTEILLKDAYEANAPDNTSIVLLYY